MAGYWTNWTPLQDRETLFPEDLDRSEPWAFKNIIVR
jgi:homospermidine synthase